MRWLCQHHFRFHRKFCRPKILSCFTRWNRRTEFSRENCRISGNFVASKCRRRAHVVHGQDVLRGYLVTSRFPNDYTKNQKDCLRKASLPRMQEEVWVCVAGVVWYPVAAVALKIKRVSMIKMGIRTRNLWLEISHLGAVSFHLTRGDRISWPQQFSLGNPVALF